MTDLTLPAGLKRTSEQLTLRATTAQFDRRSRSRPGEYWIMRATFVQKGSEMAALRGMLARLRGVENTLLISPLLNPARGAFGGSPTVNGNQGAGLRTLNIQGATGAVQNWIREGDFFALQNNGLWELKMSTADVNTQTDGTAQLQFVPDLRNTATTGTSIVTSSPLGRFCLADSASWDTEPLPFVQTTLVLQELFE